MKVSLILPVLNREERLEEVLGDVRSRLAAVDPEVIVVYDVTRPELLDAVRAEQNELEKRYGIRTVTRVNQRGFGSALRAGFAASSGNAAIPVMADCSDDMEAIPRMLAELEGGADIAVGCRYMPGGGIVGNDLKQRLSRLYSVVLGLVSGVRCRDASNSFKAYRRHVWESVDAEASSFDFSVEMTVKAVEQGYRIAEVPAVWTNRQVGRSQFGMLREFRNYVRWLLYAAKRVPPRSLLARVTAPVASLLLLVFWGGGGQRERGSSAG